MLNIQIIKLFTKTLLLALVSLKSVDGWFESVLNKQMSKSRVQWCQVGQLFSDF